MNYLVLCPCRHTIESHNAYGCKGERARRCTCRLAPGRALDAAIDVVRSTYWREQAVAVQAPSEA